MKKHLTPKPAVISTRKKHILCGLLFTCAFILGFAATGVLNAQPRKETSGEIVLESTTTEKITYKVTEERTITYFEQLLEKQRGFAEKGTAIELEPLTEGSITFLNGVYLYCTVTLGTCPTVLNALLELDLIDGAKTPPAQCPVLSKFWQQWIKSDFERRQNFLVKTGYLNTTTEFTTRERPKFVKCKETAAQILGDRPKEVLKARYSGDKEAVKAVEQLLKLLKTLEVKGVNVFALTGSG